MVHLFAQFLYPLFYIPKELSIISAAHSALRLIFSFFSSLVIDKTSLLLDSESFKIIHEIFIRKSEDEPSSTLHKMISLGGGTWPPQTVYGDHWPLPLRAYHDAYKLMGPFLSMEEDEISLDDDVNRQRTMKFRTGFMEALKRVDMSAVRSLLLSAETAKSPGMTAADWNGFFACVALSRHAYRWGAIPVTKIIQEEKVVEFPPELDLVWPFLQRRYGISSLGGCVTSNYLCNFDHDEQIVYEINECLPDIYRTAEYNFGHVFYAIEKLTLPMYQSMAHSISHYRRGNKAECLRHLSAINDVVSQVLDCYYDIMNETKIPRSYWMRYAQGFQAWGCGEIVNGEYVTYDGLSGNQLLVFQAVDAFLGLESYLPIRDLNRYIPATQRDLVSSLRRHSFSARAKESGDAEILMELEKTVKVMKAFRQAHRARVRPYLSQAAPERMMMTAGKGVLENEERPTLKAVLSFLDGFLHRRLKQTV